MDEPLLSVIVPVYNVEKYLNQCLASITGQTYRNLEILLVDDGSTDQSGAICDAWAEKDSRIQVIHQKNAGAGAARNTAMDIAQGELMAFVDSDDYLAPNMYAHLYSLMEDGVDVAECVLVMTEKDEEPLDDGSLFTANYYTKEEAMGLHIRDERFCQTPPNKLFRRETVGSARFPVGNLIDDEFFTYRVLGNARRLVWSSCKMYAYRQQPGSAMHKPFSLRRLDGLRAKRQRLGYLRERMPAVVYEAELDLYMSCLYAMQGCLQNIKDEELEAGREIIGNTLGDVTPLRIDKKLPFKKKLLLVASQRSFEGVAKMLNFLIRIHVLS